MTMTSRWVLLLRRPGNPRCSGEPIRRQLGTSVGSRLFQTSSPSMHNGPCQSLQLPIASLSSLSLPCHFMNDGNNPRNNYTNYYSLGVVGQVRWRHSGKLGHRRETLEELAHRPEREAAQERRQKKKEKAAQKKGPSTATSSSSSSSSVESSPPKDDTTNLDLDSLGEDGDDDHDDLENENGDEETSMEPTLPDLRKVESQMMNYMERFQETLASIRGGEPTAEMFDEISVMAYGSPTPLKAVGQVVIVSPTLATITCFDPSVTKDVQKAIQLAMQEVNPQLEDASTGTIKVPLPRVSMEVREQTAKQVKQKAEATKQRIRQVRRKAMDVMKKGKDGKIPGVSKDEAFASAKELDTITETVTDRLQKLVDEKIKSIMAV